MCFSEAMDVVKGEVGAVEVDREIEIVRSGSSKKMLVVQKIVLSRDGR